jgi:hypothetical protein
MLLAGCASGPKARKAREDIPRVRGFLESFPRCTDADAAAAVPVGSPSLTAAGGDVLVRGFLVASNADCTIMGCRPGECCNECTGAWVLTVPGLSPSQALVLGSGRRESSPRWSVMDCKLTELGEVAPVEVVVRGVFARSTRPPALPDGYTLAAGAVSATHVCRVEPASAHPRRRELAVPGMTRW